MILTGGQVQQAPDSMILTGGQVQQAPDSMVQTGGQEMICAGAGKQKLTLE